MVHEGKNEEEYEISVENENNDVSETASELVINRPPKPPGLALGPYYQFLTTNVEKMQWIGSALIFRSILFDQPKIELISEVKVDYDWETLYENLFDMRAYRINLHRITSL